MNRRVNRSFIRSIKNKLNYSLRLHGLDSYDFEVDFSSQEKDHIFTITHRDYGNDIHFKARSSDFKFIEVVFAPGAQLNTSSVSTSFSAVLSSIEEWTQYANAELEAIKEEEIESKAEQIKAIIAPHLQQCVNSPEDFFSNDELTNLKERLNELESRFNTHKEAFNLTQESLETLKEVINEIKSLAEGETQQRWYDRTLDKLGVWASKIEKVDKVVKAIEKGANLLEKGSDIIDMLPPL